MFGIDIPCLSTPLADPIDPIPDGRETAATILQRGTSVCARMNANRARSNCCDRAAGRLAERTVSRLFPEQFTLG